MNLLRAIFTLLRFVWGDIVYRWRKDQIWNDYRIESNTNDPELLREAIARREHRLERLKWEGR